MTTPKIARCPWRGIEDPLYALYHDEEWGVPLVEDRALFEKLTLESFQSGLSWLTILRKRENFRRAFHNFDAAAIARYGDRDIARLMGDADIVRNRMKIEAVINNAKALLALSRRQSLSSTIWAFLENGPIQNRWSSLNDAPASTDLSKRISMALKGHGFRFVGPTTVYAFMQSAGMVNDHLVACPRHSECRKLQLSMTPPSQ
ncbi:MAG: DNA-3-methyladenine glycosylase I [Hyphomicrobium sp.]